MKNCLNCLKPFKEARNWQRYCSHSCRNAHHNREKLTGIFLPPEMRDAVLSLASDQGRSYREMTLILIHSSLDKSGKELSDAAMGLDKTPTALPPQMPPIEAQPLIDEQIWGVKKPVVDQGGTV